MTKMPVLELLVERKLSLLLEESPDASAEDAMGAIVAEWCEWNAAKILRVSASAVEQAKYDEEARQIREMCDRLLSSLNHGTT